MDMICRRTGQVWIISEAPLETLAIHTLQTLVSTTSSKWLLVPKIRLALKQSLSKSETVFTRIRQFTTIGGQTLKSFAKHKKFNKDLWFDLVAPELRINMAVESWLNGGGDDLDSICTSRTSVYDVKSVNLIDISFNSSRDHSKWAVADSKSPSIVCIGDTNRQKSQFRRGGGAVCLLHRGLWKTFHSSVNSVQPCSSRKSNFYSSFIIYTSIFMFASVLLPYKT
ncbi:deoxyribonuclease-2 domain protein [Oesophagostomum dentatum]|uniref:Deoxyribonuclease-2 domain protein n=1 Tax=Oesophagostomum dentatum TaxID=61180 RepID=A0A0B1T3U0_OESDE|nr:deoxyribonuclease-2 domain protein [Oesophagostomum dentatum]